MCPSNRNTEPYIGPSLLMRDAKAKVRRQFVPAKPTRITRLASQETLPHMRACNYEATAIRRSLIIDHQMQKPTRRNLSARG